MINDYELKLDLQDEGTLMLNQNPPNVLKERIAQAKQRVEIQR